MRYQATTVAASTIDQVHQSVWTRITGGFPTIRQLSRLVGH